MSTGGIGTHEWVDPCLDRIVTRHLSRAVHIKAAFRSGRLGRVTPTWPDGRVAASTAVVYAAMCSRAPVAARGAGGTARRFQIARLYQR